MKIRNVSTEEQRVMPPDGAAFICLPGAESPELADACAADLLQSFPSVWQSTGVHPAEEKEGAP